MKLHSIALSSIFSILATTSLFTAENTKEMSYAASLLFNLAEKKQWDTLCIELHNKFLPKQINGKDFTNQEGFTLLHLAVQDQQVPTVELLLTMGASINTFPHFEINGEIITVSTPLHQAAALGFKKITQLLIQASPDSVNSTTCLLSNTPLHMAAWYGKKKTIKLLLEKGANIAAQNDKGSTPIHLAIWNNEDTSCLEKLLEHPSDNTLISATTINYSNNSPLAIAKVKSQPMERTLLLYLCSKFSSEKFVDYILQHNQKNSTIIPMFIPIPTVPENLN